MITITITAANAEEVQFHAHQLASVMKPIANPHTGKIDTQKFEAKVETVKPEVSMANEEPVKKRAVRKPKEEVTEVILAVPVEVKPPQALDAAEVEVPKEIEAQKEVKAPEVSEEAPRVSGNIPTKEQLIFAVKSITDKYGSEENGKGMLLCRSILDKFKAAKISELRDEDKAEFLLTCHKAVATGVI